MNTLTPMLPFLALGALAVATLVAARGTPDADGGAGTRASGATRGSEKGRPAHAGAPSPGARARTPACHRGAGARARGALAQPSRAPALGRGDRGRTPGPCRRSARGSAGS